MNATKRLFICLAMIAASVLVAPASMHFGVRWATATDITYLFLACGIFMAMMTIEAEKNEDNGPTCRNK